MRVLPVCSRRQRSHGPRPSARPTEVLRTACAGPWLLALLVVLATGGPVEARVSAARPPAELLVSIAIGPDTLRNVQAYAEAIKPGAGAGLTDQLVRRSLAGLVGASTLDGFNPASWMYVLVADGGSTPGFALLGKVADARTLAATAGAAHMMVKGDWAVIGARPLLVRIAPYALTAIATQATPRAPTATVYLPHVLARYRTELAAARTQIASFQPSNTGLPDQLMSAYLDGFASLGSDTGTLVVTLETTPELGALDFALAPRPGSRLAKFVALQRPTDYALLDRLSPGLATVLIAGQVDAGPYREILLGLMAAMYGPVATKDLLAALDGYRKAMTGEVAMALRLSPGLGMAFTQLFGLSDPAAADKAIVAALEPFKAGRSFEIMNLPATLKASSGTTTHDGITLRGYETTFDLSGLPAEQRAAFERFSPGGTQRVLVGTFDRLGLFVSSPDGVRDAARTIDAARGKAGHVVPANVRELLAASRARKESLAMMLDLNAIMLAIRGGTSTASLPLLVSFGFADRNAHIRVELPAATLRAAVNAANP